MRTILHDGATWLHVGDLTTRLCESVTTLQRAEILAGQECIGEVPAPSASAPLESAPEKPEPAATASAAAPVTPPVKRKRGQS